MGITKTQIKKWNDYFKSLTKPQKRVALAQDVIAQIKAKKFLPKNKTYTKIVSPIKSYNEQIQSNFGDIQCECCALGGIFLSDIKFNNSCTFNELDATYFDAREDMRLKEYFSIEQLILIEAAFECWDFDNLVDDFWGEYQFTSGFADGLLFKDFKLTKEKINKTAEFGNQYTDSYKRLIAIMENIIANNGTFKP